MKTRTSTPRRIAATLLILGAATLLSLATVVTQLLVPDANASLTAGSITPEKEGPEGEGSRADQPDQALRFRRMQLQDENGKIPADGLQKAREQIQAMKAAQEQLQLTGNGNEPDVGGIDPGSWTWLGPGNVGGRIRGIVIDPGNTNKMWVGSVGGGIWRTTDAGTSLVAVSGCRAE